MNRSQKIFSLLKSQQQSAQAETEAKFETKAKIQHAQYAKVVDTHNVMFDIETQGSEIVNCVINEDGTLLFVDSEKSVESNNQIILQVDLPVNGLTNANYKTQILNNVENNNKTLAKNNHDLDYDYEPELEESYSDSNCSKNELSENDANIINKENISQTEPSYGNVNEGRKRKHVANSADWKKNCNKQLRMEGKKYLGYTKSRGECSVGNLNEEEYHNHIKKKDRARTEKELDKALAREGKCIVLTMDLQAVKVSPDIQASKVFFKTKLCCHNFTIYDLASHHCTCYWFNECDTDLVASTFVSCIVDYLERHCLSKNLPIIIYSDGCTYQNRNNILANAILNYSMKNKIHVIQKFLERGHTQMECDSVHSCIERKLKNRDIHLPSDYLSASREARVKPFPYEVLKLKFEFFKDFTNSSCLRYSTIRPGKKTNDPTVTDIRAISYNVEGNIQVKLDFDSPWADLPTRPKKDLNVFNFAMYPQLNKSKVPIKKSKWKHLQELKAVIPDDCHNFYDSLQFS